MERERIEKLLIDAGHAINANNGQCLLIEDVLCRVTSLCTDLLAGGEAALEAEREYSEEMHRQNPAPHYIGDADLGHEKQPRVFTHCNVCGRPLRTADEDKMGMCEKCAAE